MTESGLEARRELRPPTSVSRIRISPSFHPRPPPILLNLVLLDRVYSDPSTSLHRLSISNPIFSHCRQDEAHRVGIECLVLVGPCHLGSDSSPPRMHIVSYNLFYSIVSSSHSSPSSSSRFSALYTAYVHSTPIQSLVNLRSSIASKIISDLPERETNMKPYNTEQ